MSQHPSTIAGEAAHDTGIGWDDMASLHHRDGGGLLHGFKVIRKGSLAELVRFFANLPVVERSNYMIEKAGDRQYQPHEIMGMAMRPDFPLHLEE